jgi:flagellar motility protein MotE (MotC chaperone)
MKKQQGFSSGFFSVVTLVAGTALMALGPQTSLSEDSPKTAEATPSSSPSSGSSGNSSGSSSSNQGEGEHVAASNTATNTLSASSCLSDPIVLDEIKKKREEIDQKWKELNAHEAELKARETAINEELKKLQDTRDEIAKLEDTQKKGSEEKIAKVVETLENMSPKSSAQMLSTLDDGLAVAAISQMSTQKLAKVMNVMEPARASKLTELLAGVVRAKHGATASVGSVTTSHDVAETAIVAEKSTDKVAAAKKGEKTNDQQSESIITGGNEPDSQRNPSSESK